jgi:hypothetical protein
VEITLDEGYDAFRVGKKKPNPWVFKNPTIKIGGEGGDGRIILIAIQIL